MKLGAADPLLSLNCALNLEADYFYRRAPAESNIYEKFFAIHPDMGTIV